MLLHFPGIQRLRYVLCVRLPFQQSKLKLHFFS